MKTHEALSHVQILEVEDAVALGDVGHGGPFSVDRRRARQDRQLGGQTGEVAADEIDHCPDHTRLAQQPVVAQSVRLDQSRAGHSRGETERVIETDFGVAAVVHE